MAGLDTVLTRSSSLKNVGVSRTFFARRLPPSHPVLLTLKKEKDLQIRVWSKRVARKQSLEIGRKSAFDALWGTGGTGGGSLRVAPLSAGTRQSDKRS
jgi:hypothetical protein